MNPSYHPSQLPTVSIFSFIAQSYHGIDFCRAARWNATSRHGYSGKAGLLPQHAQSVANVMKESPHGLTVCHALMRQERTAIHKLYFQSTCFQSRRLANPEDFSRGSNAGPHWQARYLPALFRSGASLYLAAGGSGIVQGAKGPGRILVRLRLGRSLQNANQRFNGRMSDVDQC